MGRSHKRRGRAYEAPFGATEIALLHWDGKIGSGYLEDRRARSDRTIERRLTMIAVRQDEGAQGLRLVARLEKVGKVVLRLLGIAHILDGRGREESAALVGLPPRNLARAVTRYNAEGIAGLKDRTSPGRPSMLTLEQAVELKQIMLARSEGCLLYTSDAADE